MTSNIQVQGKTVIVNGKPTIINFMLGIVYKYEFVEAPETALINNPGFDYDLDGDSADFTFQDLDLYLKYGKFKSFKHATTSAWWSPAAGYSWNYFIDDIWRRGINNHTAFFGYHVDEPEIAQNGITASILKGMYDYIKTRDTSHPVLINLCCPSGPGLAGFIGAADILCWDFYPYSIDFATSYNYQTADALYAWERMLKTNILRTYTNDIDAIGKPLLAFCQGYRIEGQWISQKMVRAQVYLAFILGHAGVGFFIYNNGISLPGLVTNPTLNAFVQGVGQELKEFEHFLLLPRIAYSWKYQPDDVNVSFSNNPIKTVLGEAWNAIDYRLIQEGNVYYLIVVNKDSTTISTDVTIRALVGMNATIQTIGTTGNGAGAPNRTITIINGKFSDTYEGYASVIYEISTAVAPPPPSTVDITTTIKDHAGGRAHVVSDLGTYDIVNTIYTQKATPNTNVTWTAMPDTGYVFKNFIDQDTGFITTVNPLTMKATGNLSIVVVFSGSSPPPPPPSPPQPGVGTVFGIAGLTFLIKEIFKK